MNALEPLFFKPRLVAKPWGGRRLERWGKVLPAGASIGESWDLYDRPGDSAVVERGAFAGWSLQDLMTELGPRLLGEREFLKGRRFFPLMVKLIDAREALSVQVHPDDAQAAAMVGPDESGKSEAWVVLEAEPGSRLTAGLKPGVDAAVFRSALAKGDPASALNDFEVFPGDLIDVPAGRVHAIGAGCLVAEIQQNSDTTFRVWDYGRLENGRPRELHLDQALRCARSDEAFARLPSKAMPKAEGPGRELLVGGPHFELRRLRPVEGFVPENAGDCFHLLSATRPGALLRFSGGATALKAGETCLIPAALGWRLEKSNDAELLWTRPGLERAGG